MKDEISWLKNLVTGGLLELKDKIMTKEQDLEVRGRIGQNT